MKVTLVLIFACAFQLMATNVDAQHAKIEIVSTDLSVKQLLAEIEKQTEFLVLFRNSDVDVDRTVSVPNGNREVVALLDKAFENTNVSYEFRNKYIVLSRSESAPAAQTTQQTRVSGIILDENGDPVIGANIVEKGSTANGTISDADGKFTLSVPQGASLTISYIGYVTQEILVGSQTSFTIRLSEDSKALGEVVVLGYGAQARKADLSASIGTIANIEAVKQRPATGVAAMLQGQIPGVTVRNETGNPGSGPSIVIRGKGSRRDEGVLTVVDGIPGGNYVVDEIENVVVLKDAASAAIYGAQAGSAGVILITTKKAKKGDVQVSYDGTFGVNSPYNLPQSLTAEEQIRVRTASHAAAGASLPPGWDPTLNPNIATTRTDFVNLVFRNALFQRHTVGFSGGTDAMTNRLTFSAINNEGTILNTYSKNMQIRYNGSFQPVKWVKVSEDAYFVTYSSHGTTAANGYDGTLQRALNMPRSAAAYNPDGTIGGVSTMDQEYIDKYGQFSGIHGDIMSPLRGLVDNTETRRPIEVRSSTFLEISNIIEGLKLTSRFTYHLYDNLEKIFEPIAPEPGKPRMGNTLSYRRNRDTDWNSETTLNFDRTFDKHSVGALASVTLSDYHGSELRASASGFAADMESELYQYLAFASSYSNPTDAFGIDRNLSYVGRLSYSYDNRYFLTASMRRDYAGRLPEGKKYGDFPSFTAGWKLSEEAFMPKTDMINLIKLRGSWGRIGNIASIGGDYAFNPLSKLDFGYMNRGSGSGVIGEPNYRPSMTITPGRAFNPFLTWETSEQTDFGIDLELLNSKLSLSVDWFNKRTFNLITDQNYGWPKPIIGISAPQINEGEIRNTGIEINAGWNDKIGDISYFINANLATLKNTITDIGAADPNTGKKPEWRWDDNYRGALQPFKSREGDPLYSYWLIKTDGIFQTDEEAAAYVKDGNRIQPNAKAGDLKFIDLNGDGKINDDDREYLGGYFPEMTYAMTAGLSWNNLSFSIMLQGVQGANAFNAFKYVTLNEGMGNFNRWNRILDAWPNTNEIPRLTTNDTNGNFSTNSDWYLEDASYLRIKNITVGYDLTQILRKANYFDKRKSALTLSLGAENLATFTKYTGIDPEVGGNGMDGGVYPLFRTYNLALKLTF